MKKLFILCVVVVAYFTLYPWTFVPFHEHSTILERLRLPIARRDYLDIVVNLCFYVPLGVLGVLGWWRGSRVAGRWIMLAAFGAALSFALETIQAWVPGRDSSLLDILTNTYWHDRRRAARHRARQALADRPAPRTALAAPADASGADCGLAGVGVVSVSAHPAHFTIL